MQYTSDKSSIPDTFQPVTNKDCGRNQSRQEENHSKSNSLIKDLIKLLKNFLFTSSPLPERYN